MSVSGSSRKLERCSGWRMKKRAACLASTTTDHRTILKEKDCRQCASVSFVWIAEHLADCADVVATNLTMDTTTSTEQRKGQVDETPLSPIEDAKAPLEKLLGQRPTQKELVDHNILKGSRCPAITVAMRATLTDDARILCCFASLPLQIPRSLPLCMQLSKSSSDVSLR